MACLVALGAAGTVSTAQSARSEIVETMDQQDHAGRELPVQVAREFQAEKGNNHKSLQKKANDLRLEYVAQQRNNLNTAEALPTISLQGDGV